MLNQAYFITGTDTEVGKTFITCALLRSLNARGLSTAAYKPIAAGCENTAEGLRNEDALLLQAACSLKLAYSEVNPIALAPPIAPHLAAKQLGQLIELETISAGFRHLGAKQADVLLVEGAGGWYLPLGENSHGQQQTMPDFVKQQQLPVIMVVGMRLGCLNHALLTAKAIRSEGLTLVGWVANQIGGEMPFLQDNINSLNTLLNAPMLANIPYSPLSLPSLDCFHLSALGNLATIY
jgi:dethiobiotin synthetase